jgi:hypothetical protein
MLHKQVHQIHNRVYRPEIKKLFGHFIEILLKGFGLYKLVTKEKCFCNKDETRKNVQFVVFLQDLKRLEIMLKLLR